MEAQYYTINISIHRFGETYHVEISHKDPTSQAQVAPLRGNTTFDLDGLLALHATHPEYGRALSEQLFADKHIKQRFVQVETAAQATGSFLRFSLCIDPSAQELQSLRWELLRHPDSHAVLTTSESLLFSRFMVSRDWRPIKVRARTDLTALIAVSAPPATQLQKRGLAAVDFEGEVTRIERALEGVEVRTLGGPDAPFTVDRLVEELRREIDILYVVSHGMFGRASRSPALILQDDAGQAKPVQGDELTVRIRELQKGPRLVVLASCQSAGDGDQVEASQGQSVQATLAGRLADAGVPAVIAMQGFITMKTVEEMMPPFFTELLRDGQIDRALAVARGKVRARNDSWMPALFTRLTTGRLWYTPGFRGDKGKEVWRRLLKPVRDGKVVPILGPRLLDPAHGSSHQTAKRMAQACGFPFALNEWDDLPRVAEYLRVKESRYNVVRAYQDQLLADLIEQHRSWLPEKEIPPANKKPKLGKLLALVADHLREEKQANAYGILADLPASVYVTTNFEPMIERALKANDREPQQLVSRWRYQKLPRSADEQTFTEPTPKTPLVYHVFGAFGADGDDGLVLTEDDYFDYLIETSAAQLMPSEVESALVDNSLLFLGFRVREWHFRALFRLMMSLPGRERLKQYCHVTVQFDPSLQTTKDVAGVREYLAEYFGQEANIDIFWGSAEEFLEALHKELEASGDLSMDVEEDDDDDEWNF